ncbi:MAG: hypothetical protein AB7D26_11205 [Marinobacterium sp.]|uniref:hypothetical protein n=1 Tax=Marinobacter sp. TaxID=50741 RepID=UPI003A950074
MTTERKHELPKTYLSMDQRDDLFRWFKLNKQYQQVVDDIHNHRGVGSEASEALDRISHEKSLIADRLLSDISPQWVNDHGEPYLPVPMLVTRAYDKSASYRTESPKPTWLDKLSELLFGSPPKY